MKKRKFELFSNRIYPWLAGLSADLLFFTAIYVFFFSQTKGLDDHEILLLPVIASGAYLVFWFPSLWIVRKIGNTASFRVSLFLVMVAAALFVFAEGFVLIAIVFSLYTVSSQYRVALTIIANNNLRKENKENFYGGQLAKASFIYSIVTMVIFLVGGAIFDFSNYLPMYLGLAIAVALFVLSFWFRDETEKDNIQITQQQEGAKAKPGIRSRGLILIAVFLVAQFFGAAIIDGGNSNISMLYKNLELIATIATICIFFGRISRMLSNLFYTRLKKVFGKWLLVVVASLWIGSLVLMGLSFLFINSLVLAVVLVTIGVVLFLATRDPMGHEFQQIIMDNYEGKARVTVNALRVLSGHIGFLVFGLIASAIINSFSVGEVVLFYAVLAVPALFIMIWIIKLSSQRARYAVKS
jgi:MFS family permease